VVLVAVAATVGLVVQRTSIPYSVALVLAGLALAFVVPHQSPQPVPDVILAVLLPGLVFEAAYKLDLNHLRARSRVVAVLAVPGVAITAGVVAAIVSAATGLDLGLAFLLGAIVSATDPVAVISLFKRLRAPGQLSTAVEAESLLNDGTGVVLYTIALKALSQPVSLPEGLATFTLICVVSVVIGLVAGVVAHRLIVYADNRLLEGAISLVAAYGTYLVADRLHESGIIATVVAGLVIGNWRRPRPLDADTREALDTIWDFIAFLLTALAFLLVGLSISPDLLAKAAPLIVVGYAAITIARALAVYGLIGVGQRVASRSDPMPVGYLHVMFWAGLRGAVAMALALSLPFDVPERDLLTGTVFGIVLLTILVQGTTAGWVVRHAGVLRDEPDTDTGGAP
jgi:CPA1 family monovalent cation:H+ antiporter